MSIELKPGRWRMRCGKAVTVEGRDGNSSHPWRGRDDSGLRYTWGDEGNWFDASEREPFDLVEYLGPEEPTGGAS